MHLLSQYFRAFLSYGAVADTLPFLVPLPTSFITKNSLCNDLKYLRACRASSSSNRCFPIDVNVFDRVGLVLSGWRHVRVHKKRVLLAVATANVRVLFASQCAVRTEATAAVSAWMIRAQTAETMMMILTTVTAVVVMMIVVQMML